MTRLILDRLVSLKSSGYSVGMKTSNLDHRRSKTETGGSDARERLLSVARSLFYAKGIAATGVKEILEVSGFARATLYYHFSGKDELVGAYLSEKHNETIGAVNRIENETRTARDRVSLLFDWLVTLGKEEDFRGCAFVVAAAEFPDSAAAPMQYAKEQKSFVRIALTKWAQKDGYTHPESLAERIALVYDGALINSAIREDLSPIFSGKQLALEILDHSE